MTSGRIEFPKLTHFSSAKYNTSAPVGSDFFTRSACMPKPAMNGLPVVSKTTTWRTVKAVREPPLSLSDSPFLPLPGDVRQPSCSLAARWCSPQTTGPVLLVITASLINYFFSGAVMKGHPPGLFLVCCHGNHALVLQQLYKTPARVLLSQKTSLWQNFNQVNE